MAGFPRRAGAFAAILLSLAAHSGLAACAPTTGKAQDAGQASDAGTAAAAGKSAAAASAAAAASRAANRVQDSVSADFIYHLLEGNRDSVAALFDSVSQPYVTQELVDRFQGQFKWLYNFIGGEFELFMKGGGDSAWFREYRMANETNKRYPLILIQTVFSDTVSPVMIGAQVKNFLGGKEKPVASAQVWEVGDASYDLHAITATETGQGTLMVIAFHDPDTAQLTQESVAKKALPLIREAVTRGYLDSTKATLDPGQTLSQDVGVSFIRKEPRLGLTHVKISFSPSDYAAPADTGTTAPATKAPAKK